jgi:DNA-binding ferritin-like protein (Dps family)
MDTIENLIVEELKENYESVVKELIKKIYERISGNSDLLVPYLGDELRFFMMDNYSGKTLQERLIRLGLTSVDWEEVAEGILNLFEEVI